VKRSTKHHVCKLTGSPYHGSSACEESCANLIQRAEIDAGALESRVNLTRAIRSDEKQKPQQTYKEVTDRNEDDKR